MKKVKLLKPANICGVDKKAGDEVYITDEAAVVWAALGVVEKPKQKKEGDK